MMIGSSCSTGCVAPAARIATTNNRTCPASAAADSSATPGRTSLASRPVRTSSIVLRQREPSPTHRRAAT
jgi:hypothetical protein